ncbi:MAG: glycosyltransferase [Candidatus Rokubacteria bacterium]|nr:glycosyltransferase [Candidatus Rokubacteria bacterium]
MNPAGRSGETELTVVVVMLAGREPLIHCLNALSRQAGAPAMEIIVPYDARLADAGSLAARFPSADFIALEGRRTYAELRALGVRRARGALVALTEDHCTPDPDWCARIVEAHRAPHAAIGGAVEKGPDTTVSWAVYLYDFSRYMTPLREGPARYLTDCNVSYKRAALGSIAEVWREEFHETAVNWALEARGETLWLSPRIIVRQQRTLRLVAAVRDRYAFGRLFASTRVAGATACRRAFYAGFSFLLPPLLVGRIAANVFRKRRHAGQLLRAAPALLLLTTAWAWGELVGYTTGRPGSSLAPKAPRADAISGSDPAAP